MKRIFLFIFCVLFAFSCTACGESINMCKLTEYQNGDFCAELKISARGKEYSAKLSKSGERFTLCPEPLAPFCFVLEEGGAAIISGEAEINFGTGALFPLSGVYRLFTVPIAGTWKIEKARPGGVSLYVCKSEDITLYIDANSHLPLKMLSGDLDLDVLFFKAQ